MKDQVTEPFIHLAGVSKVYGRGRHAHPANDLTQHLDGHGTGPQHRRRITRQVQHRRLYADRRWTAVDDEIDPAVEILDDM